MTVSDKHEQGLLQFFGDADLVKQFRKLKNVEKQIDFIWKIETMQVGIMHIISLIVIPNIFFIEFP